MSKHQKRLSAPKSWPIARKTHAWVATTRPGPHNREQSIPLAIILRDMLALATTFREAKKILNAGNVLVDGRVRRDPRFPVGLFDVVAIPKNNEYYRMLLTSTGKLELRKLDSPDARKLCKITDKTMVKGGRIQLNLHDGTNLIGTNDYSRGDSLILSLPDRSILKHLRFAEGNTAMILGGQHSGEIGTITGKRVVRSSASNMVSIKTGEREIETLEEYVYVIGEAEPEIRVGEHHE